MSKTVPTPGSKEAVDQGCTCPVFDNAKGRGYLGIAGIFVFSETCPLHAPKKETHESHRSPADADDQA